MCKIELVAAAGFLLNLAVLSSGCHTFNKVEVSAKPDKGSRFYQTTIAGGCLESSEFDKPVSKVFIKNQNIPTLARDSVRKLPRLHTFLVENCNVSVIEEALFRNVPRLKVIQITRNNVPKIPTNVFSIIPHLDAVILNNNNIVNIENNAFSNIPALKTINCSANLLENWNSKWFLNTTNVQIMDFQSNKIAELPAKAFRSLKKLKQIRFDFNEINRIHPEAFKGLKDLEYLGLAYNRLRVLDARSFPNALTVQELSLHANYLNFLPASLMDAVRPARLGVDGNPWSCACLDRIFDWLLRTNGSSIASEFCKKQDIPVCSYPAANSKTCTEAVDKDVTDTYLDELRQRNNPPLDQFCARLN